MNKKTEWAALTHADKLAVLRDVPFDQIIADYAHEGSDDQSFRELLSREKSLWQANLYETEEKKKGGPPNKEVVLGAFRDLDRSEAILELIDNSIDAWHRRQAKYPDKVSSELNIYIDVDSETGQLSYVDNAGGVSIDNIENLVIPGYSETEALTTSIGSYKTGGKKAIFRLASAVNITTRYWNPAETGDQALSIHLDESWLQDAHEYQFPYYTLRNLSSIERGQTKYLMQLRAEPKGSFWYKNPGEIKKLGESIRKTYSLLMSREKAIKIYFPRRGVLVAPELGDLYELSATHDTNIDLRPQLIRFKTQLEFAGKPHDLEIELFVGCRTTTAITDGKGPGFDLYGNNRLFVTHDTRLFSNLLPKGNSASLIRGYVNIIGPNVFVPWDTHKRHLNYDREVIELLRTHGTIAQVIDNWKEALNKISGLSVGGVTKASATSFSVAIDAKTGDMATPHRDAINIDAAKRRGDKLPDSVYKPKVVSSKVKKDKGVELKISLATESARQLAARFSVEGSVESRQPKALLQERVKEHLMELVEKGRKKK
jgi:Histidine kinase-, DNA gyrase B-, and HSP90-like ATPase